jgi:ribonucleoside-triphosphate reductase
VAYSLNEPAAARGYQAVFWNISYYDKNYFAAIFDDFVFPDGGEMQWESVSWLQKLHMEWLNQERLREWLTFPVETVNLVYDKETKEYLDRDWADFTAQMWAKGHSFFCYNSDSADSLSSCCRLKNGITDNVFSYTLGAGGISTGSKAVITINVNRLVQDAAHYGIKIEDAIREQAEKNIKYLTAFNELLKDELRNGLLPVYNAGYISLEKQYLTQGINGFVEAAEFLGIDISDNEEYYEFGKRVLAPIMEVNKSHRTDSVMFNTEFVPAENLGVKHATWDKEAGYKVDRDCYNSYFFRVEDDTLSLLDKMAMHGDRMVQYLDGGSAAHLNLNEHLTQSQYRKLLDVAAKLGCSYFTFNIPNTICNECGHISKHYMRTCHKCGSDNVDWLTRIIGYVKRISSWSEARQTEGAKRHYHEEC